MSTLYVVATPIGNLQDLSPRAVETLSTVDMVACEDTRRTRKLLSAFEIHRHVMSCHARREQEAAEAICGLLGKGQSVAFVSDAGTPGLSDPGSILAREVRARGFPVIPIPGPSAFAALCSVSGFPGKSVLFEGFLSPKAGRRRKRLAELADMGVPFVLYESPYRILKCLADIAEVCCDRTVLLGREMTKMHEEYLEGNAVELLDVLSARERVRGEVTLLVEGRKKD